jgi:hypothetical protein
MDRQFTDEELAFIADALDSHKYWQLSDPLRRNSGYVMEPLTEEERRCEAIEEKARGLIGQSDKTPARPVVLVVRHPDYENSYTVEGGDVRIVSLDLGSSFDSEPDDREQWEDWSSSVREDISDLSADSEVRQQVEALIAELEPERPDQD